MNYLWNMEADFTDELYHTHVRLSSIGKFLESVGPQCRDPFAMHTSGLSPLTIIEVERVIQEKRLVKFAGYFTLAGNQQ